jgi:hypothetical protein
MTLNVCPMITPSAQLQTVLSQRIIKKNKEKPNTKLNWSRLEIKIIGISFQSIETGTVNCYYLLDLSISSEFKYRSL